MDKHEDSLRRFDGRRARIGFLSERLEGVDIEKLYDRLSRQLQVGDDRINAEKIYRAMDVVEDNVRSASILYQISIEELYDFDVAWRETQSEWETDARHHLENDKKAKRFSGVVTKDMVEGWIACHVRAYGEWCGARKDFERSRNLMKSLYDAWQSRAATLRKMADVVEKRKGIDPNFIANRGE